MISYMIKYFDIFILTVIIDIILFYIYHTSNLNTYDKYNVIIITTIHLFLFVCLFLKFDLGIDVLHIIFSLNIFLFSLYVTNVKILLVYIGVIMTMLCYWKIDNRCPMGSYEQLKSFKELTRKAGSFYIIAPYIILGLLLFKIYLHYN